MKNKHSYNTRDIQEKLLPLLQAFDKVCEEHNLNYYLWAGTQLGAIRHKGFIPWDDDVDVAMNRNDYNTLLKHAHEWLPEPYNLANENNRENYPHYFTRIDDSSTTLVIRKHLKYVEGIHIDVFPLDNVPDNPIKRKLHFMRLNYYYKLLYYSIRDTKKRNSTLKNSFYSFMQKFLDRKKILSQIHSHITKYNGQNTKHCSDSFYSSSKFVAHEVIGTPIRYEFEGLQLCGVENADRYLSEKYGDYMTLPPESQRRQHRIDFLDLNQSYKDFDISNLD